jgi:hypothetical protein
MPGPPSISADGNGVCVCVCSTQVADVVASIPHLADAFSHDLLHFLLARIANSALQLVHITGTWDDINVE